MKYRVFVLIVAVLLSGCGNGMITEKKTRTTRAILDETDCEKYSDGEKCDVEVTWLIKKMHNGLTKEKDIGELIYEEWGSYESYYRWKTFKKSQIKETVDGYIKIRYCAMPRCDKEYDWIKNWFPKKEVIFYDDFDQIKKMKEEKQIKIDKRKKEIKKLYESGKNEKDI